MTSRLRPITRRAPRSPFHGQDRQEFLITAAFVTIMALLAVGLVAAVALSYYDHNIRPVARVGAFEIPPQLTRDRGVLLDLRLSREEGRLRELLQSGEIDRATYNVQLQDVERRQQEVEFGAREGLIDLIFQAQLAAEEGITVSEADIDAGVEREFSAPERRRVEVVFVDPAKLTDEAPTTATRRQALQRAQEALAALESGTPFASVATQYSTHESALSGGDYGIISADNPLDPDWIDAVFRVGEGETTEVVAGRDGIYRIGRVTEILPGQPNPAYRRDVLERMSLDRVRQFVGWEIAADRLREAIVEREIATPTEQIRLAHIFIEDTAAAEPDESPPADEEGEIHYSEILYAPNDDPESAADLDASDPAWEAARLEADAAAAELRAISDTEPRTERFAEIARTTSDSEISGEEGGDVGFQPRELMADEVANALFGAGHQTGDIIGPVKGETGYYVLIFHEQRPSARERLEQLKAELAAGADWDDLVERYSDDEEEGSTGDLGWFTREMLSGVEEEVADKLFALQAGEVSEPIEIGTSTHIFKVLERGTRPLDPDQVLRIRDPQGGAFERWYSEKKEEAEASGVIHRPGQEPDPTVEPLPGEEDLPPAEDE